jgi:hypothetical protein
MPALRQYLLEFQEYASGCLKDMGENSETTQQGYVKVAENLLNIGRTIGYATDRMEAALDDASDNNDDHFEAHNSKMDSLLQKMDTPWTENTTF